MPTLLETTTKMLHAWETPRFFKIINYLSSDYILWYKLIELFWEFEYVIIGETHHSKDKLKTRLFKKDTMDY